MPRMDDFRCPAGHVTEHLHMGGFSDAPTEIRCGAEGCELQAGRELSPTYFNPVRKGNHDFKERNLKRIRARNAEHMRREGYDEIVERQRSTVKKMEG